MKNYKYYLLLYFVLWFILFEFILPVNNILPRPSVVLLSLPDLWRDYNLPINYISSVTAVYLSLAAAYFITRFFVSILLKPRNQLTSFVLSLEWFAEFIPGIVIGLLLVYWFPGSEFIEYLFAFAASFTSILIKIQNLVQDVPEEYVLSGRSLGIKENTINRYIIWKSLQPALFKHIIELHFYIWSMMIAFEFIKGGYGIGSLLRTALEFKDISALFSTFIITGLTIYLGTAGLKYLRNKFFSWSSN